MNARERGSRDPLAALRPQKAKPVPHAFVLDALEPLDPRTKPMFGCLAVYVGERIVFILRDKGAGDRDDGVWVGFEPAHEEAVRARFPTLAPIEVFDGRVSGWLKLSARGRDFEDDVLAACELVLARDPRIGKVPGAKKKSSKKRTAPEASATKKSAVTKTKPAAKAPTAVKKKLADAKKKPARAR